MHPAEEEGHLLIAAPGNNNTGDRAMLEAFIAATTEPVTVIIHENSTYPPPDDPTRVRYECVTSLLVGRRRAHTAAVRRFAQLASTSRTVSVVGADVIDGGYHKRSAATLWALAGAAAAAGKDTRVIGFSWKPGADASVSEIAARAAQAGVQAYVRDPDSYERFRVSSDRAIRVTDSVFTLPPPIGIDHFERERRALLNISGLIAQRRDLVTEYVRLIEELAARGYSITIVPHVDNPSGSDVAAGSDVVAALSPELRSRVDVGSGLLSPMDIKALAARSSLIITGRMHLAILGMSVGTPAIVLSTQGKVSGLMKDIGLPSWAIDPGDGMSESIISLFEDQSSVADARAIVESHLPQVCELAARNYQNLEG